MQSFVDGASSKYIIEGAKIIKRSYLPNNHIVHPANPLLTNSGEVIRNYFRGANILTQNHINSYLAASVLLHTIDGWNYLSKAVDSLINGSHGISTHLAYYSELRASMSFLASEGIGIFDHEHLRIDNANVIEKNPLLDIYGRRTSPASRIPKKGSGTHQFVWDCINSWANSNVKPSGNSLLKVFSVSNKTFDEWLIAFPYSVGVVGRTIIQKWLKSWNLDVRYFKNDRNSRNKVSYSPQRSASTPDKHSVNEIIEKLNSFWDLIEPSSSNKFQLLDKYLLRIFLWEIYDSLSGPTKNANTFENVLLSTLSNLGLNHDQTFIDFLKEPLPVSHSLFIEAKENAINPLTGSLNALSVIARAMLMLRISTGSTSLIYQNAGVKSPELDFLWERIGVENGFWQAGNPPLDFNNLWDEIKEDIEDVNHWAKTKAPNLNLATVFADQDLALSFNYFRQFHRAGLWGITL